MTNKVLDELAEMMIQGLKRQEEGKYDHVCKKSTELAIGTDSESPTQGKPLIGSSRPLQTGIGASRRLSDDDD